LRRGDSRVLGIARLQLPMQLHAQRLAPQRRSPPRRLQAVLGVMRMNHAHEPGTK
jgi:hypothetical protein